MSDTTLNPSESNPLIPQHRPISFSTARRYLRELLVSSVVFLVIYASVAFFLFPIIYPWIVPPSGDPRAVASPMPSHSLWRTGLSLSGLSTAQIIANSNTLSPALQTRGIQVSAPLSPSFAGFGIEPSNLFSFAGGEQPNQLSINLLQNIADYAGCPPHLRVGGNTADYMIYDPDFTEFSVKQNPNSTGQGAIASDSLIYGPRYFEALNRFPNGTSITFGLNLAYEAPDYMDKIVSEAQAAVDGLSSGNAKLLSFEVGNEPDLYLQNGFRVGAWDGYSYTRQFLERSRAIHERVLKPADLPSNFFEPPATASTIGNTFEIHHLVKAGITDTIDGLQYVNVWNQHDYFYFIGVTAAQLSLGHMMNLDNTNLQFSYWATQVKAALNTGIPYALREMCSVGPLGKSGISDVFGSALWNLNFFLFAATMNISSVQMHMTDNSNASAWAPVPLYGRAPFIRPSYYAHVAMAHILGNGNGTTQIAAMDTDGVVVGYKGYIRAYSAYAHGELQSLVLINSHEAAISVENKPSFAFNLSLGTDNAGKDIYLSYLTAPGVDSAREVSFNGKSYSDSDGRPYTVDSDVHSVKVSDDGSVYIPVRDSQAVIANLGWVIGTNSPPSSTETRPAHVSPHSDGPPNGASHRTAEVTGAKATTARVSGAGARETALSGGNGKSDMLGGWIWVVAVTLTAFFSGMFYLL